jgi:sarcosine oxidase
VLRATPCVMAMVTQAARRGAVVRDREAVTGIAAAPGQVEVSTARGRYRARALVVTGGAWVNDVLAPLGLRLPVKVSLEQYAYFQPRDRARFMPGRFPIFIHWRARDAGYGFPTLDQPGVKIGFHFDQQFIEPGADRAPREDGLRRLRAYVQRYLPTAGELAHPATCLYTTTPDEHFVIDQAPALPNVAFCSACSGHGFKFAIGVGRALADLAQDRATEMHIDHVRWRGERNM